jgi:predicted nucleotidyltransferase
MRVTRDSLIRIARETVQERVYNDPEIIAAYLTGSLLTEDPMLGGTADIDIVLVHAKTPSLRREFVKLTPDFHIDISRRTRDEFKSPRELRGDPWLGYEMYAPLLLYEREKFFDFVQASLRAGFDFEKPALTLQRCRSLLSHGRQIWMDLADVSNQVGPREVKKYLKSLYHAVNAVAELSGPPIQERRLLLEFPARAETAQRPGMAAGAFGLIGANNLEPDQVKAWISNWKSAFIAACSKPDVDLRIHSTRVNYYEKAIRALLDGDLPLAALWPLLHTWTVAAIALEDEQVNLWRTVCAELGLMGPSFQERVQGLDQYLDEIEVLLDELATANGLESSKGR